MSCLASAYSVAYGTYQDASECNLKSTSNPESNLMFKETMLSLSDEAQIVIATIIQLPDEMFTANGKIILSELKSWMKRRHKWSTEKTIGVYKEIRKAFRYTGARV